MLRSVRVPADHLLGDWGAGFAMAQARLGPGRVHHCMRSIGQCELALQLAAERALERRTFGKYLSEQSNVQDWLAQSRIAIDQARLLKGTVKVVGARLSVDGEALLELYDTPGLEDAIALLDRLSRQPELADFLTLPAYAQID